MKYRILIIFALTALCIIGCENGKKNAPESNDEDSTVVNDTLIDDAVEDEGGSGKSLNDIRFANYDENDWLDNEYIRCLRRYLDDYNSGKIENEDLDPHKEKIKGKFVIGWDSISLALKDIIESGFDISTTQLPASRIHAPGGTLEKKVAQGYDVLEIVKGTWIEAIFAKKKDPVEKLKLEPSYKEYDEDGNPIYEEDNDENEDSMDDDESEESDDTFYSSYSEEAEVKAEDEEGFPIEEE